MYVVELEGTTPLAMLLGHLRAHPNLHDLRLGARWLDRAPVIAHARESVDHHTLTAWRACPGVLEGRRRASREVTRAVDAVFARIAEQLAEQRPPNAVELLLSPRDLSLLTEHTVEVGSDEGYCFAYAATLAFAYATQPNAGERISGYLFDVA